MSEERLIYDVAQADWDAAYDSKVEDTFADRFLLKRDGQGFVRLAFGRTGAPIDESGNTRPATYTHAITVTEHLAIQLARALGRTIADEKVAQTTDS